MIYERGRDFFLLTLSKVSRTLISSHSLLTCLTETIRDPPNGSNISKEKIKQKYSKSVWYSGAHPGRSTLMWTKRKKCAAVQISCILHGKSKASFERGILCTIKPLSCESIFFFFVFSSGWYFLFFFFLLNSFCPFFLLTFCHLLPRICFVFLMNWVMLFDNPPFYFKNKPFNHTCVSAGAKSVAKRVAFRKVSCVFF